MSVAVSAGLGIDSGVAIAERTLVAPIDPLEFLSVAGRGRIFYFERPSDGIAVATVGALEGSEVSDPSRQPRSPGTLRVGGFAFDRCVTPSGRWSGFPAASWAVPRIALRLDDSGPRIQAAATEAEGGFERARLRLAKLAERLESLHGGVGNSLPSAVRSIRYEMEALGSEECWRDAVEASLRDIESGRFDKVVLARAMQISADATWCPVRVARRLRAAHPTSTIFAVSRGAKTLVGASPERLAHLDGNRLSTAAVAGTAPPAPVGGEEDRVFLANPKERHEHAVVVDELRRRLAPFVDDLESRDEPEILATQSLRHLYTPMSARLSEQTSLATVCEALHPTPAVCGLPREPALEALRSREWTERGWYAGGIGFEDDRGGEVVVPLRAALLDGRVATLFAGAGIVAGSKWESELEETRLKMRVMQAALVEV